MFATSSIAIAAALVGAFVVVVMVVMMLMHMHHIHFTVASLVRRRSRHRLLGRSLQRAEVLHVMRPRCLHPRSSRGSMMAVRPVMRHGVVVGRVCVGWRGRMVVRRGRREAMVVRVVVMVRVVMMRVVMVRVVVLMMVTRVLVLMVMVLVLVMRALMVMRVPVLVVMRVLVLVMRVLVLVMRVLMVVMVLVVLRVLVATRLVATVVAGTASSHGILEHSSWNGLLMVVTQVLVPLLVRTFMALRLVTTRLIATVVAGAASSPGILQHSHWHGLRTWHQPQSGTTQPQDVAAEDHMQHT